ncbi:MAG: metallophosphoesterase family protein [Acidimicrobiia bacterium]
MGRPHRLEVFGAGTTWLQLTWSALGPGTVEVRAGDRSVPVEADGGPGAVVVDGLSPGREYAVELTGAGIPGGPVRLSTRTLPSPGGEVLHRIATVSDVHLGSTASGYFRTIVERPEPVDPHPLRCARAALAEAAAWGADEVVVKGGLVDRSEPELWATAAEVLGRLGAPVSVVPGNHEWAHGGYHPVEAAAAHGLHVVAGVEHHDRPGIRLVLVDSVVPGRDVGRLDHAVERVAELAADAPGPVLVAMHHQPTRFAVPVYLPAGIPGPEARRFLDALGAANPHALVTAGHTHRHRRRHHGPVTVTEVGSTKDFPGTWAGYEVHEGGIVQTVRRIAEPSCIRWTERTRRAALGIWPRWSPGRLDDRCFTRTW